MYLSTERGGNCLGGNGVGHGELGRGGQSQLGGIVGGIGRGIVGQSQFDGGVGTGVGGQELFMLSPSQQPVPLSPKLPPSITVKFIKSCRFMGITVGDGMLTKCHPLNICPKYE
jgi:hypothetical protein